MPRYRRACAGVEQLDVGHVDVHHAIEQFDRARAVVCAGVVHQRQAQAPFHGDRQGFEHLRDHMLGGDDVDVVALLRLEAEHQAGKVGGSDLASHGRLADVAVLAEHAAQIAARHEDRPGAMPPAQHVLLAEVRKCRGDPGVAADTARAHLIRQPVNIAAGARADVAGSQFVEGLLDALAEDPGLMGPHVVRYEPVATA
jgi:hypothetical protein